MSQHHSQHSSIARIVASRVSGGADGLWRSPSAWIAVSGLSLSLMVMILAVAIVVGFKHDITAKITAMDPSITITDHYDSTLSYATEADPQGAKAKGIDSSLVTVVRQMVPPKSSVIMATHREGVLRTDSSFAGVRISGYSPDMDYRFLDGAIVSGTMPDWSDTDSREKIIISQYISQSLGVDTDDRIDAFFFTNGTLRQRKLTVAGVFNTNFPDRDKLQCYGSIDLLNRMAQYPAGHSQSIEIRGPALDSVAAMRSSLVSSLQQYQLQAQMQGLDAGPWLISDIFDSAGVWLNWLELLNTNVVVILILMGAVGAFTLLSSLFILILERIRMIGILKSLGATNPQITRIFALISCRIVAFGLLIGNALALGLVWAQQHYHLMPLNPEAYYLDSVPVRIVWWQIAAVNAGVIIITAAIMLIPSRMIARLSPSSSMRFD